MYNAIDRLLRDRALPDGQMRALLLCEDRDVLSYLFQQARRVREEAYGRAVFIRGLVEFTNHCKNDCYYCGIRRSNAQAQRYRLQEEQILQCAQSGYRLGFRTIVLQGGEDPFFTDEKMVSIIRGIKSQHPDCAVTLSIGERPEKSYRAFFEAGADRYLLRHETADEAHYGLLHPAGMSFRHRMDCLKALKEIGFQTGCGFMVGSPYQTVDNLLSDLAFTAAFQPQMVGIGPFIPHRDTPFKDRAAGSALMTLKLLAIIRLLLPTVLLPATTALNTLLPDGCEQGMLAGANVVMPNLSPQGVRKKYMLYNNKASFGSEAAEALDSLRARMARIGYEVVCDRGDYRQPSC